MTMRIKICGITNVADCRDAVALGADALGLNFYAASPRHVGLAVAQAILEEMPPFVDAVGLFVNESLPQALQTLHQLSRIRTIQWHGKHPEPSAVYPFQLIAAFPVREDEDIACITGYLAQCRELGRLPDAILVDAHAPGLYGGTGRTAPWELLVEFRPGIPVILAGGLTPENVAEAIHRVRPFAVDVASGVEQSPVRKDPEKLRRFIGNAREAASKWG
jgi:phosphoribosylanthranilate isomerase